MNTLTNELIYNSFIWGAKNVISDKDYLNKINVFPVADGDTGTNLTSLMQSIIFYSKLKSSTKDTLESIASAAMKGSRGNSGIIFASYIDGFYQAVQNNEITIDEYIDISKVAAELAQSSISNPVEGTVITLMHAWVHILSSLKSASLSTMEFFSSAYEKLKLELSKTTDKLAILKENHVVDAGAKGFVHFIGGILNAISGKPLNISSIPHVEIEHEVDHSSYDATGPRYCTEAYIKDISKTKIELTHDLQKFGNSMIVANHEDTGRIHIHTNHPDQVFDYLRSFSHIIEQKVDDMKIQYETAHERKYDIAIVTDSIADLPKSFIDQYQIHVFPISLIIDGTAYFDKLTLNNKMFYDMMKNTQNYPASSQPNPKSLDNFFSHLTTYYKKIIVLTVSGKMSGTYNAFLDATKKYNTDIRVIDTLQNSAAQGLLVYEAALLVDQGKSIDEIELHINQLKLNTEILVSVKTLKYMVRNGRVNKLTGIIANLVNLKPVISIDNQGNGIIFDKAFSLKIADHKIRKHLEKTNVRHKISNYAIVHADAPKRAAHYADMLEKITGIKPLYTMEISSVVAMNAGLGAVAVAIVTGD